jgi:hypothetical protein
LLKEENDHVLVHELGGFISADLDGAFREAKALSLCTARRGQSSLASSQAI